MACTSIVALNARACGSAGVAGGTEKLYMLAHQDLNPISGTTVYSESVSGVINNIGLDAGKKFVEIQLLKSTTGLNESYTINPQNGNNFATQTLTVVLSDLTLENKAFIETVRYQPVVVLLKTRNGKWVTAGLNGQFNLSAADGGTGVAETDLIGYTLTFTGIDGAGIKFVDDTVVPTLIA